MTGLDGTSQIYLPFSDEIKPVEYEVADSFPLITKIENLKSDAGFLMSNYTNKMLQGEVITNFLALYSLPEDTINYLKSWKLGVDPSLESKELFVLKKFPKAEVHCHLGGVADAEDLIFIAGKAENDIKKYGFYLNPWIKKWERLVRKENSEEIIKDISSLKAIRNVSSDVPDALCTAAFILVFKNNPNLLHRVIFGPYVDAEQFCGIEFDQYERIGDLQGSGLLPHPSCLKAACRIIADKAVKHNVDYLEIRCSPVKYAGQWQTENDVCRNITDAFSEYESKLKVSLLFTASRHGEINQIKKHVALAQKISGRSSNTTIVPLRGFDLAGDERVCSASSMQQYFLPVMEKCMHFTIHAGENNSAKSIWEAVYYLSAERIGHGLTLKDNHDLMEKILDRNITLEMCPSSNFQIVGYRDNYFSSTWNNKIYPLKEYLDQGISVTVNTDNPGISDTDFTRELHRACRLTPQGLSMWEILSIIRNSFKASFAQRSIKNDLLKKAEHKIVRLLNEIL